eukprot:TRINITY_DN1968_c0_g1_i1.p1 TRINITY_DN1968_c0_g1~~TRINITY_DN1968_c0_g1_i1.p1  ORF type:complete len:225 (-),score=37.51 TRINITY_DN1968_c0_g1_i1:59-733(-)
MYLPPYYSYVYQRFGHLHCFNISTDSAENPAALLIRALQPIEGSFVMRVNRMNGRTKPVCDRLLCSGPAKLSKALNITLEQDGLDLALPNSVIFVEAKIMIRPLKVSRSEEKKERNTQAKTREETKRNEESQEATKEGTKRVEDAQNKMRETEANDTEAERVKEREEYTTEDVEVKFEIVTDRRVRIDYAGQDAANAPLRFSIKGNNCVSVPVNSRPEKVILLQ